MTVGLGRAVIAGGISPGTVRIPLSLLLLVILVMTAASAAGDDDHQDDHDDDNNDHSEQVKIRGFDNATGLTGARISLVASFENRQSDRVEARISVGTEMPGKVIAPETVVLEGKSVQNITIWLVPLNGTEGTFIVTVEVSWDKDHHSNATTSVTVMKEPGIGSGNGGASPPLALPAVGPATVAVGVGAGLLFAMFGLAMGTEWGKLALLNLFIALPLYTRLKRDHLMDHVHRAKLAKFIEASPGTHFSEIKRKLDLHNGVLAYHIKALEREGVIISKMDGQYRRFYPVTMSVPKKEIEDLTWHQLAILDVVRKRPGIRQKEIAEQMGESKQVVNYHLRGLVEMGIVLKEEEGRESFYTADEKKIFDLSKK